ncbi:MAG TPA: toxin-antitoxin system TumE family protein [Candidatus Brocadiia bacterium]|nr:hypothetical protein [Planctomycetota bacterium]MDO8092761.1 DUF6516 family protein [Candidatus Brocadiales bacterium]
MVEAYLYDLIQELLVNPIVSSFKVLKRMVGDEDGYIRVKCSLANANMLEFAEYIEVRKNKIHVETYSFHWQTSDGKLVKRWDNVKHHKNVDAYPHHLHIPDGRVISSEPMNLKKVLTEIEKTIT